jgi:hypothetical protein
VRSSFASAAWANNAAFEPVHRRRPTTRGQLHQRRRMLYRPIQRDPAEPPPGGRITDLPAQRVISRGAVTMICLMEDFVSYSLGPLAGGRDMRGVDRD